MMKPPTTNLRRVPPAPNVMSELYMGYVRDGKPIGLTFRQYLAARGFKDPSDDIDGMDDGAIPHAGAGRPGLGGPGGPQLVSVPQIAIPSGTLQIIVLLVDFDDQPGTTPLQHYKDLLFSENALPSGSLRDYYKEVSGNAIRIDGTVHGWFRLPKKYSVYVDGKHGLKGIYPNNAQAMAEDAVKAAQLAGVVFPKELNVLHNGKVTALFIIHSGEGAERQATDISSNFMWSHKWNLTFNIQVNQPPAPPLFASTYLTVPEDCTLGVCAHELGHLAFQWEDFYDPNGLDDGVTWAGSGKFDLMAAGTWNGDGARPSHPVSLHKSQHNWVDVTTITASTTNVTLKPFDSTRGMAVKVVSPAYLPGQYLLLEARQRKGFDDNLPGEGLLVWRVDINRPMTSPTRPALQLVQADGQDQLDLTSPIGALVSQGDDGDPFPGSKNVTKAPELGPISTSFHNGAAVVVRSGVILKNIARDANTGEIALEIVIDTTVANTASTAPPPPPSSQPLMTGPQRGLDRLMKQRTVSLEELRPVVNQVLPTPGDIERLARSIARDANVATRSELAESTAPKPKSRRRKSSTSAPSTVMLSAPQSENAQSDFETFLFRVYKHAVGVEWDVRGEFKGSYRLEPRGSVYYVYHPDPDDPFRFIRLTGEEILPGPMLTDGGSIPSIAWVIEDLNPRAYIDAYLIHDWLFLTHSCNPTATTFEQANLTLAEAIYTRMMDGAYSPNWCNIEAIYRGVSSFVGLGYWNRKWTTEECAMAHFKE